MKKITKINSRPASLDSTLKQQIKRVVAYARVSTDSTEQMHSVAAQKDYYSNLIQNTPDWVFAGLYADEGISGLIRDKRSGFNRMMDDAEKGSFDIIITKSISRFARNTVDTIVCIRRLKELQIEVIFEKEAIHTLDSKGEFMLTLLSSLAQEESRSISENVTWGVRKRFKDGVFSLPYSSFLGYTKGKESALVIVPEEAEIVRLIYKLYLYGMTPRRIRLSLEEQQIPSPERKERWHESTILSILRNEKYKGDALLQKTFTTDFLTKKKKCNDGELPKYYVSQSHDAIIPPPIHDHVQTQLSYNSENHYRRGLSLFRGKVRCGCCGGTYVKRYYHERQNCYWLCSNRFVKDNPCRASIRFQDIIGEEVFAAIVQTFICCHSEIRQYIINLLKYESAGNRCDGLDRNAIDRICASISSFTIPEEKQLEITDDEAFGIVETITIQQNRTMTVCFRNGEIVSSDIPAFKIIRNMVRYE